MIHNIDNESSENECNSDYECSDSEWINQIDKNKPAGNQISRQVFCKMIVNSKDNVRFQIDTGSTINIIPIK